GVVQLKLNQVEVDMKNCQTSRSLYQKEDFAYWCFGEAFMLQKQPAAAAALYEKAVNLKPEKAFYYYKWGEALAESQQYEQAIMAYQKAIQFDKAGNFRQHVQALLEEAQQSISPESLKEETGDTDRLKVP
ncbi:MAG: tetratricopeptide repeat protein, partial [Candidatus Parabeggiatoa sp.]|nr:tetratricopeptide repeat protein [Candidatus Parabeggiatoa sp.]